VKVIGPFEAALMPVFSTDMTYVTRWLART